ncbi:hypothetical protein BG015_010498 [Linnemannia schmuckeri]|uniref:Uncharacterized protein n=1 Tax=Linnemannia schmuckeri TaxID=64567 RepID=A0A9P5RTY9_9FUNG|nr:hypothetical protein BG015_010498 [Linnemannia schmuckeri]
MKRGIKYAPRDSREHLTVSKLKVCFAATCDEKAKEEVDKEVERMWRKLKRTKAFDDVFTAQKKAAAFDALRGKPSLPQGLVDRAIGIVKTSRPNTDTFFKHNLTTQLDTPYRQEQYRESLRLNFDKEWTAATNLHNPNATAQPGSGSSTVVSQGGMTAGESEDYLPDEDEDNIADLMERETKERGMKRLRTVTVPLKDIIRKERLDCSVDQDCKEYINVSAKGSESLWISDLQNLFSYHYLGFLYSFFFSPKRIKPGSDKKHPLWAELAKYIEPSPLTVLKSTWAPGEPHPMSGLSTVFRDYRTELATNFSNLWDGPLCSKALDFLLRFSLRFQLAPDREMRYYMKVQELTQKNQQQRDRDMKRPSTFKACKDKIKNME